jgi:dimethylaniline monooxygenase (N-oxide forming)
MSTKHNDVTVIGAGWSGLVACKYMLEEGLSVVALEKKSDIGGVWLYSDDPNTVTVMKTTRCTSSSTVTEMSDFPMPEEIGMFPHHTDVLTYLHNYAERFGLTSHIRLNTGVEKAEKRGDLWWVVCENGEEYTSSNLVITTGPQQKQNRELESTVLKGFTGKVYHAGEIKEATEEHKDKRLLVIGGGETGSDICMEFHKISRFIYWSIPRGQHFFRKVARVVPWGRLQAIDKASSRMLKTIAPYTRSKPGLSWICRWSTSGSLLAYQGHGIPEWRNNAAFFHFFVNKNGRVLELVDYKHLVPKAGISHCEGREVYFTDGTKQEFDIVIMSTGYKKSFPFLSDTYTNMSIAEHYKFVFNVEDPSLAFVGFVRPVVGSVVGISEQQARWVARVYSKRVSLKRLAERQAELAEDQAHWREYFKHSSCRLKGLVEGFTYIDDIARLAGIYPNYWELLKRNPYHWYVAYFAPANTATFRLNEPKHEAQAIATMESHRKTTLNPVHLLLIVFLRLIWFDWFLDQLGKVKYSIQVSHWWPTVRQWRLTRAANWVWTLPKRALFDTSFSDAI